MSAPEPAGDELDRRIRSLEAERMREVPHSFHNVASHERHKAFLVHIASTDSGDDATGASHGAARIDDEAEVAARRRALLADIDDDEED